MKLPQLQKKPELKSCHDINWEDDYSWIHQKDILDVLINKEKLNPEVRDYYGLDDRSVKSGIRRSRKNISRN